MTFMAASQPDIHLLSSVPAPNALCLASSPQHQTGTDPLMSCSRDPGGEAQQSSSLLPAGLPLVLLTCFVQTTQWTNSPHKLHVLHCYFVATVDGATSRQRYDFTSSSRHWLFTLLLLLFVSFETSGDQTGRPTVAAAETLIVLSVVDKPCSATAPWRWCSRNTSISLKYAPFLPPLNSISSLQINSCRGKVGEGRHKRDFFFNSQNEWWRKVHHYVPVSWGIFLSIF